jgi:hypothetical protein
MVVNRDEEFERRYEREELLYSLLGTVGGRGQSPFPKALKQWMQGISRRRKLRKTGDE